MYVTSMVIDAPDRLPSTHLLEDDDAALHLLRRLYPSRLEGIQDHDVVNRLVLGGVQVRIEQHNLTALVSRRALPAGRFGDLHRFDSWSVMNDPRQGHYLRPATALEAAVSTRCADLDGGAGVFGVRGRQRTIRDRLTSGAKALAVASTSEGEKDEDMEFLLYGSATWDTALLTSSVHYYRVANIPPGAELPSLPGHLLEDPPA